MPDLLSRWREDLRAVAPDADSREVDLAGKELLRRWDEPHRHYHTTTHLAEVLDALTALSEGLDRDQVGVTRLAAWLHDAVYDVDAPPGDTERRSARLAARLLAGLQVPDGPVARVIGLIEMTVEHTVENPDPAAEVFHDADLWILGAAPSRFDEYCAQVRQEFARVPDPAYAEGRSAILRPLLERPDLYRTDLASTQWTDPARDNLRRELTRLQR